MYGKFEKHISELEFELSTLKSINISRELKKEILFRQAIENSIPSGISVVDENGMQVYVNQSFCNLVGYSETELINKYPPYCYWPASEILEVNNAFQKTQSNQVPNEGFELMFCNSSGNLIPVQLIVSSFKLDDNTSYWLVNVIDITLRKQNDFLKVRNSEIEIENIENKEINRQLKLAKEKVREESENFLLETQKIAILGTYTLNIKSGVWKSSEVLDTIIGIDQGYERTFENWQALLHPDWKELMIDYFLVDVLQKHQKFDKEYLIIRPSDKSERWIHGVGNIIFDANSQTETMVGTIRDITERKLMEIELVEAKERAEESTFIFRNYIDNAPDGVFISDEKGNYIDVNPAASTITGYSKDELLTMNYSDQIAEDFKESAINEFQKFLETGNSISQVKFIHKNGIERWCSIEAVRISTSRFLGFVKDITKRVEAEERILASEEKYRTLVENATEALVVLDFEKQKFVSVSKSAMELFKMSEAELLKSGISEISTDFQPDGTLSSVSAIKYFQEAIEGKKPAFEWTHCNSDGDKINCEVRLVRLPADDKILIRGSILDITERKNMEQALKNSISSLDASLESTADGILIVNTEGKITKWNKKFTEMWSLSDDILTQRDDTEVLGKIVSKLSNPEQFIKKVNYLYSHPEETSTDQIKFIDGRIIERYSQAQRIGNKITGRVWSFRDITERNYAEEALRVSEEKYRTIFENVQDVFYQTDLDGKFLEISPSIKYFSGYERSEIIGRSVNTIYYNFEDRDLLLNTILKNNELWDYELRLKAKSGEIKNVSINARLIFDQNGNPLYINGALRDITERKKNELKIAAQNKELEQFAYIASHDLQEPLHTLVSISNILQEEYKNKLNENGEKYLEFISKSSGRMQALVKGLLDYSRIGKERELSVVDCNLIIKDVFSDMASSISKYDAVITVNNLPTIKGYLIELRLLFQNLISNALKFRRKKVIPEITINAKIQDNVWTFSIEDNGIGIDEKEKSKIFIIFKRLHNRNEYEGTGIGLSHCKKIVEMHDGSIWVESKPGEGSIFYFTIPQL